MQTPFNHAFSQASVNIENHAIAQVSKYIIVDEVASALVCAARHAKFTLRLGGFIVIFSSTLCSLDFAQV